MEHNEQTRQWLDAAVSGIRFFVDRNAVRAELAAHLEDKTAGLRRVFPDMTAEEAEERALSEMGDPGELAKTLAAVHRPWLGRVWMGSRVLFWTLLVITLFVNVLHDHYYYTGTGTSLWDWGDGAWGEVYSSLITVDGTWQELLTATEDPDLRFSRHYRGEEDFRVNGQTVSLRRAALWQGEDGLELYLCIRVTSWRFWERGSLPFDWLQVTDSRGGQYAEYDWPARDRRDLIGMRLWDVDLADAGPFFCTDALVIRNVDPEAEWVRLDFGPLYSVTVELERS